MEAWELHQLFPKTYDVTGYVADADTFCPRCLPYDPEGTDSEGSPVHPIFRDSEWDRQPYCAVCGEPIDCRVIGE